MKSLFFSLIILVSISSCTKDDFNSDSQLTDISIKLKSTIGTLDNLYLEIKDVQLKVKEDSNATNAWMSLNAINTGTYNIFDLRDNSELQLVDNFELNPTFIYEIRLVLGDNNFIDTNNTLHSLDLGNATPSNVLRIELISNRFYDVVIEIDTDNSIHFNEDENKMVLNPKIYTEIRHIQY